MPCKDTRATIMQFCFDQYITYLDTEYTMGNYGYNDKKEILIVIFSFFLIQYQRQNIVLGLPYILYDVEYLH